ncbi:hypothetical protein Tco_1293506 [Tanacetum coccineum]
MENSEQAFVDYTSIQYEKKEAINDQMTGALPSDTVKNPKLNANPTSSVSFALSFSTEDPQSSSHVHISKLRLLEDFYVIDMEKDPTRPLLVGRGFLATASAVIDYKKAKIAVGEGITRSIFGVKEIDLGVEDVPCWTTLGERKSYEPQHSIDRIGARPPYYAKKNFMNHHLLEEWEISRDAELNPFKDFLVFIKMVEFLRTIVINLNGNMWESKELIEKKIDWNKPPKDGEVVFVKTMKKKDVIRLDEETAKRLQAEFDEEERLAREKDEANFALIEEWDDIQAKIEADHELAQRLQAGEQEELSVEEKAKLFQQIWELKRKHFAAKSA